MQLSAEIRWFWQGKAPSGLQEWFLGKQQHGFPAGGGGDGRADFYLRDLQQSELGVKRRGGKIGVEVKGLVAVTSSRLSADPFLGPIELWAKWSTGTMDVEPALAVRVDKRRWMRKFDTSTEDPREIQLNANEAPLNGGLPDLGCNVELTEIHLEGRELWWSLGFEAFGTLWTVEKSLRAVALTMAGRRPPPLGGGVLASYPVWLKNSLAT